MASQNSTMIVFPTDGLVMLGIGLWFALWWWLLFGNREWNRDYFFGRRKFFFGWLDWKLDDTSDCYLNVLIFSRKKSIRIKNTFLVFNSRSTCHFIKLAAFRVISLSFRGWLLILKIPPSCFSWAVLHRWRRRMQQQDIKEGENVHLTTCNSTIIFKLCVEL